MKLRCYQQIKIIFKKLLTFLLKYDRIYIVEENNALIIQNVYRQIKSINIQFKIAGVVQW